MIRFAAAAVLCVGAAPAFAQGDVPRGETLFADCAACHSLEDGVQGLGPSLSGMFGRPAGEIADFRYSPALTRSGIVWTAETLDAYIADPQAAIPGNRMPYSGMPDAQDRADLIAYFMSLTE